MASMSARWRNASVARETSSILRKSAYRSRSGADVDIAAHVAGGRAEATTPPHFNVMQLRHWSGSHPGLVAVLPDCDALTAATRLDARFSGSRDGEPDRLHASPEESARFLARASADIGCAVAPAPRQQPSRHSLRRGFGSGVAVVGSVSPSASGGWASTGAVGFEEDLFRRTSVGPELESVRLDSGGDLSLPEGGGVWVTLAAVFRGPAASVGAEGDGQDYQLRAAPCVVSIGGVVPPSVVVHDRVLSTNEASVKPKTRRALLLAAYAQLNAARAGGAEIVVVEPLGLGSAGCSCPPVAVARLYRSLLYQYFPGVFRLVVFALGPEGSTDPCAHEASRGGRAGDDFLAGSGDAFTDPATVAAAAVSLARGWLESEAPAGTSEPGEGAAAATAAAAGASASAGSASVPPAASGGPVGAPAFSESLSGWGLTRSSGVGTMPPVAADSASLAARALSLLPALTPSQVATHPARAFLHVMAGAAVPLPAPATSKLRHLLGLESTPPDSSLIRRQRRAVAVVERSERVAVPGGAAAAALSDAGDAVVTAFGRGGWRGRGSVSSAGSELSGSQVAPRGGFQPSLASVNGSSADGEAADTDVLGSDGTEMVARAGPRGAGLVAADEAGPPSFLAGAIAFAAPGGGEAEDGDML